MKNRDLDYYICPECHNSGEYDITVPGFSITCCRCGHRDSYVRCDNCGVEGAFVKNISIKPHEWVCNYCSTINKLNDNFYKSPIRISDSRKIKKRNTKKDTKSEFLKGTLAYLALYCILLTITLLDDSSSFDVWKAIEMIGATSVSFILNFFGLKVCSWRLKEHNRLRIFIERLHISQRIVITHICIFMVTLLIVTFNDGGSVTKNAFETERIDPKVIIAIEETFKRIDITKIVRIGDKYIITFSDESIEVFECPSE